MKTRISLRSAIVIVLATCIIFELSSSDVTINVFRRLAASKVIRRLVELWPWQKRPAPSVHVFMSFPDSGSKFSLAAVEMATGLTTASFYGKEVVEMNGVSKHRQEGNPAYEEMPEGPFVLSDLGLPDSGQGLLTRTFCGGHCFSSCTCEEYYISPEDFMKECALADNGNEIRSYLDTSIVSKAVIMVRNPFDNIISRFHYEHRLSNGFGQNRFFYGWGGEQFTKDAAGFRDWCSYIDEINENAEKLCFADDPELLRLMENVPCHSEFNKYIHWYNNAFLTTRDKNVIVTHYDDFFYRPVEQVEEVLDFMRLDKYGDTFDYKIRDYTYYYTVEEKRNVIALLNHAASEETAPHMSRYLVVPED